MDRPRMLAVIGTAGRQDDAERLSALGRPFYDAMRDEVARSASEWDVRHSVSGGAAWADHLAVRLFLEGRIERLTLHLPAAFTKGRFAPNPSVRFNPGQTMNRYHAAFSSIVGIDSLGEIADAIRLGVQAEVHEGFQRRNLMVARDATHVVALTFGYVKPPVDIGPEDDGFGSSATAGLKDGGTAHTWRESWRAEIKRHVSLEWLERQVRPGVHRGAKPA